MASIAALSCGMVFQIVESSERAKDKASIYAFPIICRQTPACRSVKLLLVALPQRGNLNTNLAIISEVSVEYAEKHNHIVLQAEFIH